MLNIRPHFVFDPKNPPVFGTKVQFRTARAGLEQEREFTGANHADEALAFVRKHVCALLEEEFKKLPAKAQELFTRKPLPHKPDEPVEYRWFLKRPVWNWHVLIPTCSHPEAHT